jgi:hypothetical protein
MSDFITDRYYEEFADPTMVGRSDRFDDVLVESASRNQEYIALLSGPPVESAL